MENNLVRTSTTSLTAPSIEELTKMMESFPKAKKMYLIADDPFLMKPLPLPVFSEVFNEDKDRFASFKVRTYMDYGVKADPRSAILYTACVNDIQAANPAPNVRLRIACLAVAIVLFVMIWSTK